MVQLAEVAGGLRAGRGGSRGPRSECMRPGRRTCLKHVFGQLREAEVVEAERVGGAARGCGGERRAAAAAAVRMHALKRARRLRLLLRARVQRELPRRARRERGR